jgi:hypothetical protein
MLALRAEDGPHRLDDDDTRSERDEKLILRRAVVEPSDQPALQQRAEDEHEHGSREHADDEGAGIAGHHIDRIGADHEQRAMRQVEHAQRAENDGEPAAYERQQHPKGKAVEGLRNQQRRAGHLTLRLSLRTCTRSRTGRASPARDCCAAPGLNPLAHTRDPDTLTRRCVQHAISSKHLSICADAIDAARVADALAFAGMQQGRKTTWTM